MAFSTLKPWASLNWPNRISILRLLLVAPFVVLLMNQQHWPWGRYLAAAIFTLMAVSDALDGMLARRMGARTRLGAILDPLADKVMVICSVVLLALPDFCVQERTGEKLPLPNWIVVLIVGKDLWVIVGFVVVYLVTDRFLVRPTRAGKLCTFGQVCMVGVTLVCPDLNALHDALGTGARTVTIWATGVLCVLAAVSYIRLGLSFVAAEEKPLDDNLPDKKNP